MTKKTMMTAGGRVAISRGESRGDRPVAQAQQAAFKKISVTLDSRVCPEMPPVLH